MKKNKRSPVSTPPKAAPTGPLLSKRSLQLIGAGVVMLILGYIVLSFADSKAQNIPGKLSPFLILGGYGLIGYALFQNKKQPAVSSTDFPNPKN